MAKGAIDRSEIEAALKRAARVAVSGARDARAGRLSVRPNVEPDKSRGARAATSATPDEHDR